MEISQSEFLAKYNIKEDDYIKTNLDWTELERIYDRHIKDTPILESYLQSLFSHFSKLSHVHSVRYRVKDAEHVIEKIIRKKISNPNRNLSYETYFEELDDLVGLRILHLFKDEWEPIHEYITERWNWKETPTACYRKGDSKEYLDEYEKKKLIKGKFYVEKCATIYSKGDIYYELTLSKASDFNNKFERLTFYSKQYIPDNYSVNITSVDDIVDLNVGTVKIKILISYKVAIRVCELQNLFKIFGETKNFGDTYREYRNLMDYLTNNESTIKEILCLDNVNFSDTLKYIQEGAENHYISLMLNKMRNIVKNNKSGCNIIRYLTTKMVNTVIRDQLSDNQHPYLSNLYLHKKSGMFDAMPYAMSLHNHNPNFYDLIKAIDVNDRDDELLASYIKNNTENKYQLYTPIDEIGYFDNIPHLVELYNSKIKSKLKNDNSLLVLDNNFLYINEYEKNSINIIKKLDEYASSIDSSLTSVIDFYMELIYDNSVSEDKEKILKDIFKKGSIAFIYGPAGTGKTKMIELL